MDEQENPDTLLSDNSVNDIHGRGTTGIKFHSISDGEITTTYASHAYGKRPVFIKWVEFSWSPFDTTITRKFTMHNSKYFDLVIQNISLRLNGVIKVAKKAKAGRYFINHDGVLTASKMELANSNANKLNRLAKSNIVPFSRKTVEQSNLICLVDG
ncbi:hypothetical protein [Crocosphaera sp.]|uniref:hypothetical protein n=1 Tax=Crocosphaera sp. TaxID=2729996 RepID=UPI0026206C67|nr:hypothetical protein [Crocosphaera sp.]MDJ0580971.1 hypothetical protein [Crocosphaera sp.]